MTLAQRTATHCNTLQHTQDAWDKATAIIYVTLAQMLCGVAKDLTKLGGKTGTKHSQTYVELNSAARKVLNTLNTYVGVAKDLTKLGGRTGTKHSQHIR